jgi:hypothetical protein
MTIYKQPGSCPSPKLRTTLNPFLVTMLREAARAIHFRRIFEFWRGTTECNSATELRARSQEKLPQVHCLASAMIVTCVLSSWKMVLTRGPFSPGSLAGMKTK